MASKGGIKDPKMYVGEGARNVDKEQLELARDLAAAGWENEDIWALTGWFQGHDGEWRTEISDEAARFTGRGQEALKGNENVRGRAIDFIDHPELYANYPDLADMDVMIGPELEGWPNVQAAIMGDDSLYLRNDNMPAPDVLDYAIHEMQHGVQMEEDFLNGDNPRGIYDRMMAVAPEGAERDLWRDRVESGRYPKNLVEQEWYRNQWGEEEAWDTQARRRMTPEHRRQNPPEAVSTRHNPRDFETDPHIMDIIQNYIYGRN